eukprot:5409142-Amphidinium_carterae.1
MLFQHPANLWDSHQGLITVPFLREVAKAHMTVHSSRLVQQHRVLISLSVTSASIREEKKHGN